MTASIHFSHTHNSLLMLALLVHLETLIKFDTIYLWKAIADYHLTICCQCFGTGTIEEWGSTDLNLQSCTLVPYFKLLPTQQSSSSLLALSQPGNWAPHSTSNSTVEICFHYNSMSSCQGCN
uniref:Uncharacterized protein n=1 Tax=Ustilago hordei TaxID=120017 RepID=Q2A707_USTHO|nr:hypothetical protein UHO_0012 [Ustilago hordei]